MRPCWRKSPNCQFQYGPASGATLPSFADGLGATIATGFAAAAITVITAIILTPYFRGSHFNFDLHGPQEVASTAPLASNPGFVPAAKARAPSLFPRDHHGPLRH